MISTNRNSQKLRCKSTFQTQVRKSSSHKLADLTIVFGIPMVATIGAEGRPTENLELQPDIKVDLPYGKFMKGEDTQLERAVEELLKEVEE